MDKNYYYDCVKSGKSLKDVFIVDSHMHLGCDRNFPIQDTNNAKMLVSKMNRCGIDFGGISSLLALGGNFEKGNDEIIALVRDYPGRFYGQIVINPNYPEMASRELERCWSTGCFKEIKIHPVYHKCPANGDVYRKVYHFASGKNCPVLIHVWGVEQVSVFFELAKQYPDVTFILGHAGGEIPAQKLAVSLAKKYDNIILDITGSWHYEGMLEFMVKEAGEDKVVFGTDAVFHEIYPVIGRIAMADMSDTSKRKVFGLNMKRILKLA